MRNQEHVDGSSLADLKYLSRNEEAVYPASTKSMPCRKAAWRVERKRNHEHSSLSLSLEPPLQRSCFASSKRER